MNAGFRIIQISKLPCHAKHRNICNHKERQAQECKDLIPLPTKEESKSRLWTLAFPLLLLPHGLEFQLTNIISIELGANKISKDMMSSKDFCKLTHKKAFGLYLSSSYPSRQNWRYLKVPKGSTISRRNNTLQTEPQTEDFLSLILLFLWLSKSTFFSCFRLLCMLFLPSRFYKSNQNYNSN